MNMKNNNETYKMKILFLPTMFFVVIIQTTTSSEYVSGTSKPLMDVAFDSNFSFKAELLSNLTKTDSFPRLTSYRTQETTSKAISATESLIPTTTIILKNNMTESELIHEKWKMFEKTMKRMINSNMMKARPMFLRFMLEAHISAKCSKGITAMLRGLMEMKSWAFRMLDASAKIPSGLLDGTLTDFGDYDECLAIKKMDGKKNVEFTGQYCRVKLAPLLPPLAHRGQISTVLLNFSSFSPKDSVFSDMVSNLYVLYNLNLELGICVPSMCSAADIREIAKYVLKDSPIFAKVDHCEVKESIQFSRVQIASMTIIGIILALAIAGTLIDIKPYSIASSNKMYTGLLVDSLICFTVNKNLSKLLKATDSKENFGVIGGLRVLSLVWIILGHTYVFVPKQIPTHIVNAQDALNEVTFGTIQNPWVSVDTFFLIGGFLTAFWTLKYIEKNGGSMNFVQFCLWRIWRLMPPLISLLFIMFLLPLLGSGPIFKEVVGKQVQNCEKYWWQVLIIPINSWVHYHDMCLTHTWYIGSDLLFYVFTPLLLISLYRWPLFGFMLILFLTLASMVVVAAMTILHNFYPTLLLLSVDESFSVLQLELMHIRPYSHIGPYLVGIILGYLVLKHREVPIRPLFQLIGWCMSITCNLAIIYGPFEWHRGNFPTQIVDVTYAMFHRTVWSMGVAWLMFMCITGKGGIVNKFLSWNLFIPLARLSYSAYLLHFPVILMKNGLKRTLFYCHHFEYICEFIAILVLTLCFSLTFTLLFEAPFFGLGKVWFSGDTKKMENSSKVQDSLKTNTI